MRVRAIRDCFVGHHWRQGEEGEYSGPKNKNLEPVKASKLETGRRGDEEAKAETEK
jgi:hypothetical protein